MNNAPYSIDLDISGNCNLCCPHCNKMSDENQCLSTSTLKKLIDELYEQGIAKLLISGGEPTLRKDWLDIVIYSCEKLGMMVALLTNGTLWKDSDIIKLSTLKEPPILTVSIDGDTPEIYGRVRRYKDGSPAQELFDRVLSSVALCVSLGLSLCINIVVTQANVSRIDKIIKMVGTLGANSILIIRHSELSTAIINKTHSAYDMWESALAKATHYKKMRKRYYDRVVALTSCPWELVVPLLKKGYNRDQICDLWHVDYFLDENTKKLDKRVGCTAGVDHCAIDAEGNVLPCSIIPTANRSLVAGNIKEHSFSYIWKFSDLFKKFRGLSKEGLGGKCGNCNELWWCKGGCRVRAAIMGEGLYEEDPGCPKANHNLETTW